MKQIESGGDGEEEYDEMKWPNSVICTSFGDIVVCDTLNHRILVFTRNLLYKYSIGSKGNFHGQFDEPVDVAIGVTNNLLIADKNNNRIEVYEEHLVFHRSKTKINAFIRTQTTVETNPDGTKSAIVTNSSRSNSLQFKYKDSIRLDDQPVKICISSVTAIFLVTTRNGSIFIFNASYRNLCSYKLTEHVDLFDMRNFCIHKNGNELIMLKNVEDTPKLMYYQFQDNLMSKLRNVGMNKSEEIANLNKINLVKSVDIQRFYYSGICMERGLHMKQTPDNNHIVIYDSKNLCVLIYDLEGIFMKVLFHSYDCLEQLLAMTFSPEGHFITCEYEIRNSIIKSPSRLGTTRSLSSAFVRRYIFKIKIYRYLDCDCHRNKPSITKKRLSQTAHTRRVLTKVVF